MVKILLLQGANLTFLGRREPEIYGSTTPADLDAMLRCHAHNHAYQLEIFYTNIEGEAINRIYQAVDEGFDGITPPNATRSTVRATVWLTQVARGSRHVRLIHWSPA
jgi:3-dehydroquinate dehydratase